MVKDKFDNIKAAIIKNKKEIVLNLIKSQKSTILNINNLLVLLLLLKIINWSCNRDNNFFLLINNKLKKDKTYNVKKLKNQKNIIISYLKFYF